MSKITVDTSVIVEYIDRKGELHDQAGTLFSALLTGRLQAILPHPTLVETYYVAAKLYQKLRAGDPESAASKLVEWLYRLPTSVIPSGDVELAREAGRAKLNYGLAFTDCYILAASKIHSCKALFKKPEREMLEKMGGLKREYQILFLEDYK